MSWIAYDLEIRHAIPDSSERIPGVVYAEGWGDHEGMGVACVGTFDGETGDYRVFLGDDLEAFADHVLRRDLRVSFNGKRFDDLVLQASGCHLPTEGHFDILERVWSSLRRDGRAIKGHGLSALAEFNLGKACDDRASICPELWQAGRVWSVVDHCLRDVELTADLYRLILESDALQSPIDGRWIHLGR